MATKYKMENGQRVLMTDAEEADLIVESSNIKNNEEKIEAPYINQRRNAYPEIGDQLDMLWHSIDQDPQLKSKYFKFYEAIKAVKTKCPK